MSEPAWGHHPLTADLFRFMAAKEDRITMTEIAFGDARPDVYTVDKSYAHPNFCTYEVKVSRADLRQDLLKTKWEKYQDFSHRVYFAMPYTLEYKDLLSGQPVGIMIRFPSGWRVVKSAPRMAERVHMTGAWMTAILIRQDVQRADIDRMEREKEELLKKEIGDLYLIRNDELRTKLERIKDAERNLGSKVRDSINDYQSKLKHKLGIGYYWGDKPEDMIKAAFLDPMLKEFSERFVENFVKQLKIIEEDKSNAENQEDQEADSAL